MQEEYLKAKQAVKYAGISKSTLRRRLSDELKRSGLRWDDPPSLIRERTSNIVKVSEGIDDHGQELYHWEYSIPFLNMVKEGTNSNFDYTQRRFDHSQTKSDYSQKASDHSQESSDHGHEHSQEGVLDSERDKKIKKEGFSSSSDHSQESSDYSQKEPDHSQGRFDGGLNRGQSFKSDYSQRKNGFADHGHDYVQVSKDYFDMLKEEYKAKKKLEEDYRNKDNQINLIVQNLSKAMETLKDRIKALEAPQEKSDYQNNEQDNNIHEVDDLNEKRYD